MCSGTRPVMRAPIQPPDRPGEARCEDGPVDSGAGGMRREAGDPEKEADDEVRPRGPADVHADRPDERRHTKRPQDDSDRAPEDADEEREAASPHDTHPLTRAGCDRPEREIDTAPDEDAGDQPVQQGLGDVVGEQRPADRADHRRRRSPRHDMPVDAPIPCVLQPTRPGSGRRDRDVRARGGQGATRREDDQRQPEVPSTSPSIEPRYPATNDPAAASASSQASRAAPPGRRPRSRPERG